MVQPGKQIILAAGVFAQCPALKMKPLALISNYKKFGGLIMKHTGFLARYWKDIDGSTDWQDVEYKGTKDNQWAR